MREQRLGCHRSIVIEVDLDGGEEGLRFIESIESNIGGQQSERQLLPLQLLPLQLHKFPPPEVPNSSAPAPHLPRRYVRHPFYCCVVLIGKTACPKCRRRSCNGCLPTDEPVIRVPKISPTANTYRRR